MVLNKMLSRTNCLCPRSSRGSHPIDCKGIGRLEHRYLELGIADCDDTQTTFPCLTTLMDRDNADDCRGRAVDACNDSLCEFEDIWRAMF